MANVAVAVKGTRPEGVETEVDASRKVREMFSQIAPRYDLLNHLLSLDLDRLWRKRAARLLRPILQHRNATVLDLCCGTGDLALALARVGPARIIGADFSHAMLVRARAKIARSQRVTSHSGLPAPPAKNKKHVIPTKNKTHVIPSEARNPLFSEGYEPGYQSSAGLTGDPLSFVEADALRLPFASSTFDLVTTAFGFRNLANYEAGLREIQRVLKPGGTIAILEFTEPPAGFLGDIYRWYFCKVLPPIGGFISGKKEAYNYLPKSVARFFRPPELAALMGAVGYGSIDFRVWTLGTVALHTATRPSSL